MHTHAIALLEWYIAAGVDELIDSEPHDRTKPAPPPPLSAGEERPEASPVREHSAQPEASRARTPAPPPAPLYSTATTSPAEAIAEAEALAAKATTLAELEEAVRGFDGLAIKKTATHTVFADGNPDSRLMLLGEAPGMEEDRRGIPFCGPSGYLLDKMFAAIGRDRTQFYISNTVFWRPPGNRQPSEEELAICRPFVEKHIALVKPQLLVLIGGTATKGVLQETRGITRLRGQTLNYSNALLEHSIPVIATFHPSYLLRQPAKKRESWQDLLTIDTHIKSSITS